jgi:alkylhydroperoxidase family enzyme
MNKCRRCHGRYLGHHRRLDPRPCFARNDRKRARERNPPILRSSIRSFRVGCPLTSGSPSPCALPSSIRCWRWQFITATGSRAKSKPRKQRRELRHTERVSLKPSAASRADLEALTAQGLTEAEIVTLSQIISFVAYQIRVAASLALIAETCEWRNISRVSQAAIGV